MWFSWRGRAMYNTAVVSCLPNLAASWQRVCRRSRARLHPTTSLYHRPTHVAALKSHTPVRGEMDVGLRPLNDCHCCWSWDSEWMYQWIDSRSPWWQRSYVRTVTVTYRGRRSKRHRWVDVSADNVKSSFNATSSQRASRVATWNTLLLDAAFHSGLS